jgi:DNA-binding CsgD family transcriptional regulator
VVHQDCAAAARDPIPNARDIQRRSGMITASVHVAEPAEPQYARSMGAAGELADRAEALCQRSLTAKALRAQLVALIRRAVPFDGYNFPLTDPASRVFTSPLADVPGLPWPRLPELIRSRYLTTVGRWDRLMQAGVEVTSLLVATAGHPEQSLVWREVQRDLGVSDTAFVVFWDRFGLWALLDLWRLDGRTFSGQELRTLATLVRPVTAGLRAAISRTFVDPDQQLHPIGPAVIILDPDLQVRNQTDAAAEALLRLNPPDEPMAPVPAAVYNIASALVAAEHDVPVGPISSRIHLGGSRWVTIKASRLGTDIAVSIEPSTPSERLDIYARASGLTVREVQVLSLLGEGLETREIAERLVVSEHTASDHVKAVLAKTGARTRQVLLARGLGAR